MAMMSATLLENPDQSACSSRREAELAALVEKLLGEMAQLRGEVAELRQQAGYWKGMFEHAKRKNEKLQKEIDSLRTENRQLKDKLFAAKSEKKRQDFSHRGADAKSLLDEVASPREGGACGGGLGGGVRKGRSRRLGGGIEKGIPRHARSMKRAAASSVAERG
ncbi:MAG TPA: hypothetical protein VMY37_23685 [Thermoguttaceae bacterium]|nr:hypothetical protein [Thermoguttaceae bacterium]